MDYGMIGKIEKAKRYAQERNRIHIESFSVTFEGDNNPHTVQYSNGECMALEIILDGMSLAKPAQETK
jgi:Zn/Cd-binding protein ZinT